MTLSLAITVALLIALFAITAVADKKANRQ